MKKIILVSIAIIISLPIYFLLVYHFYPGMTERGQFGDMFGALNAIFSGLALLGVIYAILLQKKDLELQREELKLTRDELSRTAKAQENSEKALLEQATSLKITAQLNGKSAILQHYNTLIEMTNSARYGIDTASFNGQKEKADEIINEINQLIKDK